MSISKQSFGILENGTEVFLYTLTNRHGAYVQISNYGGLIPAICVPDKQGKLGNVTLGCKDLSAYIPNDGYISALIGRVGNRICRGEAVISGQRVQLARNSNGHHLHGGDEGFDKKVWSAAPESKEGEDFLVLRYVSPDGEENYPGELRVTVTYGWNDQCELSLHYEAAGSKDTLVNLTHHAYFNLAGQDSGNILDHTISIDASAITAVDDECIPTGAFMDVAGTPFDLQKPKRIGDGLAAEKDNEQMRFGLGYDHNYVLNHQGDLRPVVRVTEPSSGRSMEVATDMNGIQFYTGNFLSGTMVSPAGKPYQYRAGFCLETQYYPDSINHKNFPDPVLKAGEKYDSTTIYRFGVAEEL